MWWLYTNLYENRIVWYLGLHQRVMVLLMRVEAGRSVFVIYKPESCRVVLKHYLQRTRDDGDAHVTLHD